MIVPDRRSDIPILVVRAGEMVRFSLGFTAKSADVYVGHGSRSTLHRRDTRAVAWRVPRGRADRIVTLDVQAPAAGGSAAYLARFRIS